MIKYLLTCSMVGNYINIKSFLCYYKSMQLDNFFYNSYQYRDFYFIKKINA